MQTNDIARPMTLGELKRIEARANAATPGSWDLIGDDEIGLGVEKTGVGYSYDVVLVQVAPESDRLDDLAHNPNQFRIKLGTVRADAEFIAHARADVPALTAYIRRLLVKLSESQGDVRDLRARADKAERSLIEIIHTVKRIADGAS